MRKTTDNVGLMRGEVVMEMINMIILFLPIIIILAVFYKARSKYKNGSIAGAFFLEDEKLVLNTGIPYPIPVDEIDYIELHYNPTELEIRFTYNLSLKVVKKDGKSKEVFYKGSRGGKMPNDMAQELEKAGIRCVLPK